ncbi:hypothetical protein [Limobrevibacterium gyesilva]|uniref:Hemerythrin domain-containing protein n=1 Tax=Limobrevibacterium gyesilva TaxID=2991712 RepID=A0AA41YSB7_9PROT|nr:hypothetical protein [Limobrevibacterium gyesilva]MCW3474567.1 hypothetical protein [Limobrevibacterium gyesilva]
MAFTVAAWVCPSGIALAQAPQPSASAHEIPQSLRVEHEETLQRLSALARRRGPVGDAARKALVLFKRHIAREEEYILPPLTLLPVLADGKVTPDMKWALAMTDRVKAEREQIFQEHTQLTDALNAIVTAAQRAHDNDAVEFARAAAADSLNDIELLEPMVVVIGDYLHSKLPAGQ